jgi:hypothetical protein
MLQWSEPQSTKEIDQFRIGDITVSEMPQRSEPQSMEGIGQCRYITAVDMLQWAQLMEAIGQCRFGDITAVVEVLHWSEPQSKMKGIGQCRYITAVDMFQWAQLMEAIGQCRFGDITAVVEVLHCSKPQSTLKGIVYFPLSDITAFNIPLCSLLLSMMTPTSFPNLLIFLLLFLHYHS